MSIERARAYETELYKFLDTRKTSLLASLTKEKSLSDAIKAELNATLEEFGKTFTAAGKTAAA